MRLASFAISGLQSYGIVKDDGIVDCGRRLARRFPDLRSILGSGGVEPLREFVHEQADHKLDAVRLLPPIPNPDKIICVGINYLAHIKELGREPPEYPTIFARFSNTQVGHGGVLVRPRVSTDFDYEGELAVIVGRRARHVPRDRASEYLAGYACYNDASIRDWQSRATQVTPAKNFLGTGGFGPWMVTPDAVGNIDHARLETRLNGAVVQSATVDDMIFDIPYLIEYCSTFTELVPGDVLVTGTAGGVGMSREPPLWMKPGDTVEVEIEGIGSLRHGIVDEVSE